MRVCLVSLFTEEVKNECFSSTLNKEVYCKKYGIDYRFFFGRASTRHAQWDKIQCLIQTLPEYDYVIWMDSDAVFNNFEISFLDIINEDRSADAQFCHDVCYSEGVNHLLINAGVMIFKNTDWSSELLNKVWNSIPDYNLLSLVKHSYDGFPHEQGKLCEILLREDNSKFKIHTSTKFNAHPNCSNEKTFIVHYMGSRQSEAHLRTFLNEVEKVNKRWSVTGSHLSLINLKKHKICITSHFTENVSDVANITIPNKESYSKKHGYDFKFHKGRLSKRHPGWDKVLFLKDVLKNYDYEYVVWLDNDTYITNPNINFDFIICNNPKKNLIICSEDWYRDIEHLDRNRDYNNLANLRIVNTGIFILKNNQWSLDFLNEVWNTRSNTNCGIHFSATEVRDNIFNYDYWPFEQGPFHIALSKRNEIDYKILKSEVMNKFKFSHSKRNFICHFIGEGSNAQAISDYIDQLK